MPRRPSRQLQTISKWAGLCLCVAIAGVWLGNRWYTPVWLHFRRSEAKQISVENGRLEVARFRGDLFPVPRTGPLGRLSLRRAIWPRWRWGFEWGDLDLVVLWNIAAIPLWAPLLLTAAPTAILWYRSRRPPPGHCPCGYNLSGLNSKPCPECGR